MSIVGLMVAKDEEDILPLNLKENAKWLDAIIAIDNGSNDSTLDILESYDIVKDCRTCDAEFNERYYVPLLLEIAYAKGYDTKDTFFVDLDADEIYDSKIADILNDLPGMVNTVSVDIQYMLGGKCYKEQNNWARIYRNNKDLFDFSHIKKLHNGKIPIPKKFRINCDSGVKVKHYQIRSYEQGMRKYFNYLKLDPDGKYQDSYEHIRELAESLQSQ